MADRVEHFEVYVAAGTQPGTPFTYPMVFRQGIVREIDVRIPPGPSGEVGFRLMSGGAQYLPRTDGAWIIADDEFIQWPIKDAITSGSFGMSAYNTDIYAHTLYVSFQVDETTGDSLLPNNAIGQSSQLIPSEVLRVSP